MYYIILSTVLHAPVLLEELDELSPITKTTNRHHEIVVACY